MWRSDRFDRRWPDSSVEHLARDSCYNIKEGHINPYWSYLDLQVLRRK